MHWRRTTRWLVLLSPRPHPYLQLVGLVTYNELPGCFTCLDMLRASLFLLR
uniref:Uncharacterized protein n=1 Tax=Rhizophora mucronata TaxID=61149 RepID=A0A2P2NNT9_RHIMU